MGNYHIEDIKSALEKGQLTPDLIGEKLQRLVDMEYQKPVGERDEQLILTCEKLLYELYTGQPYVSRKEENKQALLKRLDETPARPRFSGTIKRVLVCACALITCAVLAEGFLHRQWFSFGSSPDNQQYIVQGHEITPQIIAKSIAEHDDITELTTNDLKELTSFIGFDTGLPAALSESWQGINYHLTIQPSSITVTGRYANNKSPSNTIAYIIQYFDDIKSTFWNFEQDTHGTVEKIAGDDVYFADNIDKDTALWMSNNSIHQIAGQISKEELINLINKLLGEKNHE